MIFSSTDDFYSDVVFFVNNFTIENFSFKKIDTTISSTMNKDGHII